MTKNQIIDFLTQKKNEIASLRELPYDSPEFQAWVSVCQALIKQIPQLKDNATFFDESNFRSHSFRIRSMDEPEGYYEEEMRLNHQKSYLKVLAQAEAKLTAMITTIDLTYVVDKPIPTSSAKGTSINVYANANNTNSTSQIQNTTITTSWSNVLQMVEATPVTPEVKERLRTTIEDLQQEASQGHNSSWAKVKRGIQALLKEGKWILPILLEVVKLCS